MDFSAFRDRLVAAGYSDDTAYAKIAHDIVLKAIRDAGFHDKLTVKGGVVMSSITDIARRATMDMDLDFLRYPLSNDGIRKFVSGMNRIAPVHIDIGKGNGFSRMSACALSGLETVHSGSRLWYNTRQKEETKWSR